MRTTWGDLLAEGRWSRLALIILGVWLNAADSLVSATIMPSVGADLGGYVYFSWATAGFLVGAILAGASAGRLSEKFGLGFASAFAGVVFAAGCAMSALAPGIEVFLFGRLVQGVGSGWISGFAMVVIAVAFPHRHLVRVFAAVTSVWGVATVVGPLLGGLYAQRGDWRGVFWLFALQAAVFSVAAIWLLKGAARANAGAAVPWRQLGVLAAGVTAIALANVIDRVLPSAVLFVVGLVVLVLVVRIDGRSSVRLLPHRAGDLSTVPGAAYAAMFSLTAASMGLLVYGPLILQQTRGLSPLWAGYAVGAHALAWTIAALLVARAFPAHEPRYIRAGACCIVVALILLTVVTHSAALGWFVMAAVVMGVGFGLHSSLMNRAVITALSEDDRAVGSAALIAVRQTGGAVGAALAGLTANIAGFTHGLTLATAQAAAIWVFATVIPLAVVGAWAAFRLTGSARNTQTAGDTVASSADVNG